MSNKHVDEMFTFKRAILSGNWCSKNISNAINLSFIVCKTPLELRSNV